MSYRCACGEERQTIPYISKWLKGWITVEDVCKCGRGVAFGGSCSHPAVLTSVKEYVENLCLD